MIHILHSFNCLGQLTWFADAGGTIALQGAMVNGCKAGMAPGRLLAIAQVYIGWEAIGVNK